MWFTRVLVAVRDNRKPRFNQKKQKNQITDDGLYSRGTSHALWHSNAYQISSFFVAPRVTNRCKGTRRHHKNKQTASPLPFPPQPSPPSWTARPVQNTWSSRWTMETLEPPPSCYQTDGTFPCPSACSCSSFPSSTHARKKESFSNLQATSLAVCMNRQNLWKRWEK